jgi:hypothetical protein
MNLLHRLKPEYVKRLNQKSDDYTELVSNTLIALENEQYVSQLKYYVIVDLQFLLNNPTSPYNFFRDDS